MLLATGMAVAFAATAHAANYKMVLCAAGNGSNSFDTATNTTSPQKPAGIFNFENHCGPAPDPAGSSAYLRIVENQESGNAGEGAFGSISWTAPPYVAIIAAGGYTREPDAFNGGWRARFWGEDFGGGGHPILMQGVGMPNKEFMWAPTTVFTSHVWPFPNYGEYRRFVFELTCMWSSCDRAGQNAADANTFILVLSDGQDAKVAFTNGSALMGGGWVRGTHAVTWNVSDAGSGLRWEHLLVNGAERKVIDHSPACNLGSSQPNSEFARVFQPCPTGGPYAHSYTLETASVPDGARTIEICGEDYAQAVSHAAESCDRRTIHVDNTAPGTPLGLHVVSPNPARYLDHFGAKLSLPPDPGSPIVRIHYDVLNSAGNVVAPERVVAGINPTELPDISGPAQAGDYRLRAWLEDEVGFKGPVAVAPIPHDTSAPAAPQDISVAAPQTSRAVEGFDVRWRNLTDSGSPISAAHYQVLSEAGKAVVPTQDVSGESIQTIRNLDTPKEQGNYTLRLWLSDAEGNVGAPISAPLAYDCVRSDIGGGLELNAGLDQDGAASTVVREGEGATLTGTLNGPDGQVANAPLCVFSQVVTDQDPQFLGMAMTGRDGRYQFAIGAGASRDIAVVYRAGQRELTARATLQTRVHPIFRLHRKVVRNKTFAVFTGSIPGPDNNNVVVVLQVKSGNGWRVFRRYRTREGGQFVMRYRFTQTTSPTTYVMRAQVRAQSGYPYEQGSSQTQRLRVVPAAAGRG